MRGPVTVAGAGMAGLVAAVRLRELGVETVVLEKGTRAGGSMLLSSCVVWRFRTAEEFARECPAGDLEEFYGRALPAPPAHVDETRFVELTQLYGRFATAVDEDGEEFFLGPVSWSENDLVQAIARQPGATAWYVLDPAVLAERVRDRTVGEMVDAAQAAGGQVRRLEDGRLSVHVAPGVTHTIGGVRVEAGARVLTAEGVPVDGLYAAGADVGGISSGGYASGLASALVLGLAAAESAAAET